LTTPAPQPTALLLVLSSLPNLLLSSPQLVTDLHPELLKALTHSRPLVRRAAVLVLGRLWASQSAHVPISTEIIAEKLRERLADDDPTVIGAAVNVSLELASVYTGDDLGTLLALAPDMFELLTTSTNNWMLIKIIKIAGAMCHELGTPLLKSPAVYAPDARRAATGPKAPSSLAPTHRYHAGYVTALRVHQRRHRWRHARR
jgi:hypothetical protein